MLTYKKGLFFLSYLPLFLGITPPFFAYYSPYLF